MIRSPCAEPGCENPRTYKVVRRKRVYSTHCRKHEMGVSTDPEIIYYRTRIRLLLEQVEDAGMRLRKLWKNRA